MSYLSKMYLCALDACFFFSTQSVTIIWPFYVFVYIVYKGLCVYISTLTWVIFNIDNIDIGGGDMGDVGEYLIFIN